MDAINQCRRSPRVGNIAVLSQPAFEWQLSMLLISKA
jgi:hypothetical protein